ncbi:unnamed protein product [Vitrella brassicaformis CCMP3155]|uniref:Uncharacterized protein n=1 Tax=Vitrella brassicaformis (strain CCMP3155) TaxID=1169540 RepID=A0A0G4EJ33_VITBC|nr:unnamed protein product [Vitrella brassicaformis CCMP3155]|eukprot:CEL97021.1 unnamed protein product [Vitrella brassicaformis CCMP3155]
MDDELLEVDLSHHRIDDLRPLELHRSPVTLTHLDLSNNRIQSLAELRHLRHLVSLNLSNNHITTLLVQPSPLSLSMYPSGPSGTPDAEHSTPDSALEACSRGLRRLDLSSNRLGSLRGLWPCRMLERLSVRRNKIWQVEDLEPLQRLVWLDLGHNSLASPLSLRPLSLNTSLVDLVLEGNPLTNSPTHRATLINFLPSLHSLDGKKLFNATQARIRRSLPPPPQQQQQRVQPPALTPAATHSQSVTERVRPSPFAERPMHVKGSADDEGRRPDIISQPRDASDELPPGLFKQPYTALVKELMRERHTYDDQWPKRRAGGGSPSSPVSEPAARADGRKPSKAHYTPFFGRRKLGLGLPSPFVSYREVSSRSACVSPFQSAREDLDGMIPRSQSMPALPRSRAAMAARSPAVVGERRPGSRISPTPFTPTMATLDTNMEGEVPLLRVYLPSSRSSQPSPFSNLRATPPSRIRSSSRTSPTLPLPSTRKSSRPATPTSTTIRQRTLPPKRTSEPPDRKAGSRPAGQKVAAARDEDRPSAPGEKGGVRGVDMAKAAVKKALIAERSVRAPMRGQPRDDVRQVEKDIVAPHQLASSASLAAQASHAMSSPSTPPPIPPPKPFATKGRSSPVRLRIAGPPQSPAEGKDPLAVAPQQSALLWSIKARAERLAAKYHRKTYFRSSPHPEREWLHRRHAPASPSPCSSQRGPFATPPPSKQRDHGGTRVASAHDADAATNPWGSTPQSCPAVCRVPDMRERRGKADVDVSVPRCIEAATALMERMSPYLGGRGPGQSAERREETQ